MTSCPGSTGEVALTHDAPLFSWSLVPDAAAYDLVVLPVPVGHEELVDPVLRRLLPGGVTSWTPLSEESFSPGRAYAWYVRAVPGDGAQGADAGPWSVGRYFRTRPRPTREEAEAALRRLAGGAIPQQQAAAARGVATDPAPVPLSRMREALGGSSNTPPRATAPLVSTATAALVGRGGEPSDQLSGVVGITGSPNGAGVVAANLAGGPDLVLGSSALSSSRAKLRSEEGDLVIESGGDITLEIPDGEYLYLLMPGSLVPQLWASREGVRVAALQGDGSQLTGVEASDVVCTGCVSGRELAGGITGADIQNRSLGSAHVTDLSTWPYWQLTGAHISGLVGGDVTDGTIRATRLAASAVGPDQLQDGSVRADEIAAGAVGASEIQEGALRGRHFGAIKAVKVECFGECTDSTLGDICGVIGVQWSPLGVTCSEVDPFTPVSDCGGDNTCRTLAVSSSVSLQDFCEDVSGADAIVFCMES